MPSPVTATTCRVSPTVLSMMPGGQTGTEPTSVSEEEEEDQEDEEQEDEEEQEEEELTFDQGVFVCWG